MKLTFNLIVLIPVIGLNTLVMAASPAEGLVQQAQTFYREKKVEEALGTLGRAIALDSSYPRSFYVRGRIYQERGQHEKAIADFTTVTRLDRNALVAFQQLGEEHFLTGKFKESVADFNKVLDLNPMEAPSHWQRGISLYYAGDFAAGRKQFELHQTINPNDVENAIWHFLCVARMGSVEKARESLIPITDDKRIPMMKVHALFAGKAKPEDVLADVKPTDPPEARLYAHLYLGLYFDALKDDAKMREHISKAAEIAAEPAIKGNYMGGVAIVHAELLRKAGDNKSK